MQRAPRPPDDETHGQSAARLAKLEGADAAGRESVTAAPPSSEAAAARARRARVDTGSGAGMGSLALPFTGSGGGGGGSSRGAMAVVTLGASAGSEGASPDVRQKDGKHQRAVFVHVLGGLWCCLPAEDCVSAAFF